MNNIGQRIKELRKKNDLTQETLADFLGITYKAVSKWECGMTVPDISLIMPLSRILHVTADELLGGKTEEADLRRAELDERCENNWKYDQQEMYELALQAVKEYPGDYKYLMWLASMEYYMAYEDQYKEDPTKPYSPEMIERSIKHSNMVIEGCTDFRLREKAIWNAMICCQYSDQQDKAMEYAKMFPDRKPITRDRAMEVCLKGEELIVQRQAISYSALGDFCMSLMEVYRFAEQKEPHVMAALDTEEAVIKTVFTDGNYLNFHWHLYCVYEKRTQLECRAGMYDKAIEYLKIMLDYGKRYREILESSVPHTCTCGIFDRLNFTFVNGGNSLPTVRSGSMDLQKPFMELVREELMTEEVYAPLREREDFRMLLE